MWPLYLPAPATIRMGIRALKLCRLSLFFSLNFTAFVSAKLGRNENCYAKNLFVAFGISQTPVIPACLSVANILPDLFSPVQFLVFGRSLYTSNSFVFKYQTLFKEAHRLWRKAVDQGFLGSTTLQ